MIELVKNDQTTMDLLVNKLESAGIVEFKYNNLYYEVCESVDTGYMIDIYSSNERYNEDEFMDKYKVDGGLCTGSAKEAIVFMLPKENIPVKSLIQERKELKRKLKNVTFKLKHKHYVIKKDGNKLGKRKYTIYLKMYFRMLQLKMDVNSTYGTYGNESYLKRPVMFVDEHTHLLRPITDFKVGDRVINRTRDNTEYTLDTIDLIRFQGEDLVLIK